MAADSSIQMRRQLGVYYDLNEALEKLDKRQYQSGIMPLLRYSSEFREARDAMIKFSEAMRGFEQIVGLPRAPGMLTEWEKSNSWMRHYDQNLCESAKALIKSGEAFLQRKDKQMREGHILSPDERVRYDAVKAAVDTAYRQVNIAVDADTPVSTGASSKVVWSKKDDEMLYEATMNYQKQQQEVLKEEETRSKEKNRTLDTDELKGSTKEWEVEYYRLKTGDPTARPERRSIWSIKAGLPVLGKELYDMPPFQMRGQLAGESKEQYEAATKTAQEGHEKFQEKVKIKKVQINDFLKASSDVVPVSYNGSAKKAGMKF